MSELFSLTSIPFLKTIIDDLLCWMNLPLSIMGRIAINIPFHNDPCWTHPLMVQISRLNDHQILLEKNEYQESHEQLYKTQKHKEDLQH